MSQQCFAVYVEKELVGKHIKSSKVKVLWQIAFDEEFVVHLIELRHSIVSGKREVLFDNNMVYANKALFQGTFEYHGKLSGHDVRVTVEDTFEGYLYDMVVDNVMFHRMPRKSLSELEALRADKRSSTVQTDFAAFTGKSKAALDGEPKKRESKQRGKEESLIDLDWDAAVKVRPASTPQAAQVQQNQQFNPFDSTYGAPAQRGYDPFGGQQQQSYNSYAVPSAIQAPPPQAFNTSYQGAPQYNPNMTYQQQQPYDPFGTGAPQQQYQYPPTAQRPQPQAYDPFG